MARLPYKYTTTSRAGKKREHTVYTPASRFKKLGMRLGAAPSTFVTVHPPGRPDVNLVIGCLPGNFKGGRCVSTTLQKKVRALNPCGSRARSKNPVAAWIVKDGKRILPSPTVDGAQKMVDFYNKEFPGNKWTVEVDAAKKVETAGAGTTSSSPVGEPKKNPALLVMSNPVTPAIKNALAAYRKFHMVDPKKAEKGYVPEGWPKTYITIGYARRFDWVDGSGQEHSRRFPVVSVKLCTTAAMKEVYLFGNRLGVTSGKALRVDYDVPPHSGRNKWASRWWHPHDSHPSVEGHSSGKAARIHGPGLKVDKRGIIG